MAFIRWIIALPLIVGAILFALAHPEPVMLTWNPFKPPVELPLYFVALIFLGGGLILGTFITWLSMGSLRRERRQQKKRIKELEKDINTANEKINEILATHKPVFSPTTPAIENNNEDHDDY